MWILLLTGLPALLSGADVSGITLFGISGTAAESFYSQYSHVASRLMGHS